MSVIQKPKDEARLRARLAAWDGYEMTDELRPVVVFDEELSEDRLLFRAAYAQREAPSRSWAIVPPLPPSVDTAVTRLRGEMDLEGREVSEAHAGAAARWTDRGLVGLPAMMVWFSGIKHPYKVLTTEDLPEVVHVVDVHRRPIWLRHPGAYLHPDGRTLDASFRGYVDGVDYTVHQVLETDSAVTFSVTGTWSPGVEAVEDQAGERWTTITLDRPLGRRFVLSDHWDNPVIVVDARPRNWARDRRIG